MIELKGKYNEAKVYTDILEQEAISQIIGLLNQPWAAESKIRIMSDAHAGAGCVIGFTQTIGDGSVSNGKVVPNLVGVDIGCGMLTIKIADRDVDFARIDEIVHENVPMGFNKRTEMHSILSGKEDLLDDLRCISSVDVQNALLSIGTLGGGNHFIEMNRDSEGYLYLVIHTGSRHLGIEVASHYQKMAIEDRTNELINQKGISCVDIEKMISEMKKSGRTKEIENAIKRAKALNASIKDSIIPNKDLAYLEGEHMQDYLHDMAIAQAYAKLNRRAIAQSILEKAGLQEVFRFETIHNYIDIENGILRKGSISAMNGEMCLIPLNMRDGSLICIGKGNPDWNYSAPHGAGRLMSRSAAKEQLSLAEFRKAMEGVYTTSVSSGTIDESPMAYKPAEEIIRNIDPTVKIVERIVPVYNCKAQ